MGLLEKKPEKIIKEALKVLDKKQLSLIVHGSSFPDLENEDTAYGNYNSNGAKKLIDSIAGVFTSIQLGPNGKLKSCDSSPYTSTIFSGNPLFIDLKQLTTEKWDFILSNETFEAIVNENPNKGINKTISIKDITISNILFMHFLYIIKPSYLMHPLQHFVQLLF